MVWVGSSSLAQTTSREVHAAVPTGCKKSCVTFAGASATKVLGTTNKIAESSIVLRIFVILGHCRVFAYSWLLGMARMLAGFGLHHVFSVVLFTSNELKTKRNIVDVCVRAWVLSSKPQNFEF